MKIDPAGSKRVSPRFSDESLDRAESLDSYEGVELFRSASTVAQPVSWRGRSWDEIGNALLAWVGEAIPGVAICALLALAARGVSHAIGVSILGFERSPISAIMITICIGLLIRNTVNLPSVYDKGVKFCITTVLRVGVALLGIRLSLFAAGSIGLAALPIVITCIASALIIVALAGRVLGLSPRLSSLIAVGTSICGVSAIVATAPVVEADDDEVTYSVACVTLFGMIALLAYPFLAHTLFDGDPRLIGLFLGTAIHDTAQVAGAGLMVQQQFGSTEAMETAVVVKLVRNLFLIAVIPLMAVLTQRRGGSSGLAPHWTQLVPMFVVGFVAMVAIRTLGDMGNDWAVASGSFAATTWSEFVADCAWLAAWFLAIAMAGVGLGTRLSNLRTLGWRPLAAGLVAAVSVGGISGGLLLAAGYLA
ncbi:MAG: putative sulfate exporter family transporter [bacterium]|nr:putative sulfate exporter family transporter [bacterium]